MRTRKPFQGVAQIARYNARFYAAAPGACAFLAWLARCRRLPHAIRVLLAAGSFATAWWTLASLLVSHWVYDRSILNQWRWVAKVLPRPPRRWASLHCGLDETSAALHKIFPDSDGIALDFYDETMMREPSIAIARRLENQREGHSPSTPLDFRSFPQCDNCFDTIFLVFSAHEIREADARLLFFQQVNRVLQTGGSVLLVEHPRDAANFAAFGPGCFHFWPRSEWCRLARETGFQVEREYSITPFVRAWLWKKPD